MWFGLSARSRTHDPSIARQGIAKQCSERVHPQAPFLLLLVWNFQPFISPDPLYALMVHMPAAIVQHPGNHAITVATVFTR